MGAAVGGGAVDGAVDVAGAPKEKPDVAAGAAGADATAGAAGAGAVVPNPNPPVALTPPIAVGVVLVGGAAPNPPVVLAIEADAMAEGAAGAPIWGALTWDKPPPFTASLISFTS